MRLAGKTPDSVRLLPFNFFLFERRFLVTLNHILEALAQDNQPEIARLFPTHTFTLIELADESEDEDGTAALTAEVEDFLVLVAFTSNEHVEQFAEKVPDMFESEDDIPAFTANGNELMGFLPTDFGILFNPESSDCFVMSPAVIEQLRAEMPESDDA